MKKNFAFIVQGEGRGHLTQAITLYEMVRKNGHEVKFIAVGKSNRRIIPEFFYNKINAPIVSFWSPNFTTDKKDKYINMFKSILYNFFKIYKYWKSVSQLNKLFNDFEPDIVINFYEPLIGLYNLRYKKKQIIISIAHQYIYLHPSFKFPEEKRLNKLFIKLYTKFCAYKSDLTLAISTYFLAEDDVKKLVVIPPLLRQQFFNLDIGNKDYLLIYIANSGYMETVIKWHKKNRNEKIHCFTDSKIILEKETYDDKLTFHKLDDNEFIKFMSNCKAFISTAGFESICEAMYLGKPIMVTPIKGHFEQYCNSRDAFRFNEGFFSDDFDISYFIENLPYLKPRGHEYKNWVNSAEHIIMSIFENIKKHH